MANDAAQSLRADAIIGLEKEGQTIADGARVRSLGINNWRILQHRLQGVVEVSEANITRAVRLLFSLANLKAEPTGALAVAALLEQPEVFRDRRVCCVVTGGNADPHIYRQILDGKL